MFYSTADQLKRGQRPCRCATNSKYTEDQITYKVTKELASRGYLFLGWVTKPKASGRVRYLCPVHGEKEMKVNKILTGRSCAQCKGHRQQEAYINRILDEEGMYCALKFGIANDSKRRIKEQNLKNIFPMQVLEVWQFTTAEACKNAEQMCKKLLDTEVVSKYAMKDGYTETVELSCLASIQNIYTLYGGKLGNAITENVRTTYEGMSIDSPRERD